MQKTFGSILVLGLVLVWATPAQAELGRTLYGKKGTWTLGGELAFDADWSKQYKPTKVNKWNNQYQVDISPELGYTFVKGFEATIGPIVSFADGDLTKTLYGGTLSAWYHYQLVGTLFLSTGLRFSMAVGTRTVENETEDTMRWLIGPRFGLTMSFGGRFGGFVRLAVKYDFGGHDVTTGATTSKQWQMNLGLVSSLGLFF